MNDDDIDMVYGWVSSDIPPTKTRKKPTPDPFGFHQRKTIVSPVKEPFGFYSRKDTTNMGGKPSKGTPADKRLTRNKPTAPATPPTPPKPATKKG